STAYDALSNRLIVFGGRLTSADSLNDVWVLTNANGLGGASEWIRLEPEGVPPEPRGGHSMTYDANSGRWIVTEGNSGSLIFTFYRDVWVLDHANGLGGPPVWQRLPTHNSPPTRRTQFASGYSYAGNRLVVGFGYSEPQPTLLNDTWVLTNAS